jgi:lysophospholipase L1-like esterase
MRLKIALFTFLLSIIGILFYINRIKVINFVYSFPDLNHKTFKQKESNNFWVIIGDSQAEGNPLRHGRLHNSTGKFDFNYPDSIGQLSYHLRELTHLTFYNQGICGETSNSTKKRFLRDALGLKYFVGDKIDNKTLKGKPKGIIIITGINDFYRGLIPKDTKSNLEWIATTCKDYNVKCVILNLPGDAINNQTQCQYITDVNNWLKKGALLKYGTCVIDYNSWWNDAQFSNDNIHHNPNIVDDIHPSIEGYKLLASLIYNQVNFENISYHQK